MNDRPLIRTTLIRTTLTAALTVFLGFALAGPALAQSCNEPPRNPQNVSLGIVNGAPDFTNKFCNEPGSRPGDLCNEIGDRPRMVFKLQGEGVNDWRFVRMELSVDGANWSNPRLPAGAYDDLGFSSDPGDPDRVRGWPPVSINGSGRQMTVRNDNCHEFDIHYRLLLENRSGEQVYAHPRLRNRGIGG
ncbi:MAG: hypothetical protein V2I57_12630 [Xanthomonadales bacterium]|nr:hypothetical protein [Xanthomonadales bacterium]